MSLKREVRREPPRDPADVLGRLADKIACELLKELGLDGVVVKLHLGVDAAVCGVTSVERSPGTPPMLDDIVMGECEAMTKYVVDQHGAVEGAGSLELPHPDGSRIAVHMPAAREKT